MANLQRQYASELKRIEREISLLEARCVYVEPVIPKRPKRITRSSVNRLKKITKDVILSKASIYDVGRQATVSGRAVLGTLQRTKTGQTESANPETGEYYEPKRRKTKSKTKAKHKDIPSESDIIIDNTIGEIIDFSDIDSNYPDIDMTDLNQALNDLANFQPDPNWTAWETDQKYKQVRKTLQGIQQIINERGKDNVAKAWNENASEFNSAIERVIVRYGTAEVLDEVDADINSLLSSLGGAMSFQDSIDYGY